MKTVDEICMFLIEQLEDKRVWSMEEYKFIKKFGVEYKDWRKDLYKVMGGLMDVGIVMKVVTERDYYGYLTKFVVVEDVRCIWEDVEVE